MLNQLNVQTFGDHPVHGGQKKFAYLIGFSDRARNCYRNFINIDNFSLFTPTCISIHLSVTKYLNIQCIPMQAQTMKYHFLVISRYVAFF